MKPIICFINSFLWSITFKVFYTIAFFTTNPRNVPHFITEIKIRSISPIL